MEIDEDKLIVGVDRGDRRDRPLSGLAIGGTKAGQFLRSEAGDTLVVPIMRDVGLMPHYEDISQMEVFVDRERYYWKAGLRGEFEINFWLHEDIKTVRDALKVVFQIYADTYRD